MGVVLISFQYLCPNAKKYMPQISAFAIDTSTLLAFVRFLARLSNNPMHHCDSTRCLICLLITLNSNFLAKQQHYKKASTFLQISSCAI
ncbi:ABC transporter G family member [Trichinella pseudospiralis]